MLSNTLWLCRRSHRVRFTQVSPNLVSSNKAHSRISEFTCLILFVCCTHILIKLQKVGNEIKTFFVFFTIQFYDKCFHFNCSQGLSEYYGLVLLSWKTTSHEVLIEVHFVEILLPVALGYEQGDQPCF